MKFRHCFTLAVVALSIAAPGLAQAHLVSSGMGAVYDGAIHFALSPEDYLPLLAVAFFAGLRGPSTARLVLVVLPTAWGVGGAAALTGATMPAGAISVVTAVMFLLIGGGLALNVRIPRAATAVVAAALGLLRGSADLSGVDVSWPHIATLSGIVAIVFVAFGVAASLTLALGRAWLIVAVRVSGSWLAASGLLLAGWIWRYGAHVAQP